MNTVGQRVTQAIILVCVVIVSIWIVEVFLRFSGGESTVGIGPLGRGRIL
jgi:hypothetical protein